MQRKDARRRAKLDRMLTDLQGRFSGRILDVDSVVVEMWGEINGRARMNGAPLLAVDSLIAATAIVHRLIVVTRNVKHFDATAANVFNPFNAT
jgi:predicted nucleic acid-binding protein